MKKRFVTIIVAIVLSLTIVCCACKDNKSNVDGTNNNSDQTEVSPDASLTSEEEDSIKKAFVANYRFTSYKVSYESVRITGYCGKYNGALVAVIHCDDLDYKKRVGNRLTLGGKNLVVKDDEDIYLFKQDSLSGIEWAYKRGALLEDDLAKIQKKLYERNPELYNAFHIESFDISSLTLEEIDAIKKAFVKNHYRSEVLKVSYESVRIMGFYGRYNGALAVVIHCTELDYADCGSNSFTVNGVELLMAGGGVIYVFKQDVLYGIKSAYEENILLSADLTEIQKKLYERYSAWYDERHILVPDASLSFE